MIWQTIGPVWIDCLTVNVPTVWAKEEWVWMFGVFFCARKIQIRVRLTDRKDDLPMNQKMKEENRIKSDIEIAQSTPMLPISQVAEKAGIDENLLEYYGKVKAKIDIRQNKVMSILTIVTTIFMPLTLIVGWYGMNVKMPEVGWPYSYPIIILASIAVTIIEILIFKKKKWF